MINYNPHGTNWGMSCSNKFGGCRTDRIEVSREPGNVWFSYCEECRYSLCLECSNHQGLDGFKKQLKTAAEIELTCHVCNQNKFKYSKISDPEVGTICKSCSRVVKNEFGIHYCRKCDYEMCDTCYKRRAQIQAPIGQDFGSPLDVIEKVEETSFKNQKKLDVEILDLFDKNHWNELANCTKDLELKAKYYTEHVQ